MSFLVVENLTKHFQSSAHGAAAAVRRLAFSVQAGELLAVVGPSGSGKTTTLRLLAGLEKPDEGTICLGGTMLQHVAPQQRDIAMVFQQPALFPHLNVFENLSLGLRIRKSSKNEIDQRVNEAASFLGLADKLDRVPHELSGGEAQRVALGRALVRQPKLFLLDEPFANLDIPIRRQLRSVIQGIHQQLNVPMIVVTHDPAEALALGHRIAVLQDGRLQQIGSPEVILRHPATPFVEELFSDQASKPAPSK